MKIEFCSKCITLMRYAGQDESKKPVVAKIGTLALDTVAQAAQENDQSPGNLIPFKVWENLTMKEQKQLIEELSKRQLKIQTDTLTDFVQVLLTNAGFVKKETVNAELAENLYGALSKMQLALRTAGFPRQAKPVKAPALVVESMLETPAEQPVQSRSTSEDLL